MCAFFAYDPTKGAIKVTGDVTTSVDDKLGTPGTGEPAHAGGSTGLIGWLRDILASQSTAVYYTDTTTPLAAGATFTGSSRTMNVGNNYFNATFYSQEIGNALGTFLQNSLDGTTEWAQATPVNQLQGYTALTHRAVRTAPFYRVTHTNGEGAQTLFRITSSQTPN